MAEYFVVKVDTCDQCGGTMLFDREFENFKSIAATNDRSTAFQFVYLNGGSGDFLRKVRVAKSSAPELFTEWDGYSIVGVPSDEQLQQVGAETPCFKCDGAGSLKSNVSLSEALAALGR